MRALQLDVPPWVDVREESVSVIAVLWDVVLVV